MTRPAPFELLSGEVAEAEKSHGLSIEGKRFIDFRIQELKKAHMAEVGAYSTGFLITLTGLAVQSVACLSLSIYAKRKTS